MSLIPIYITEWAKMNDNPTFDLKERVLPRTPAEELLAEIYTVNLKVEILGVFDEMAALNASQAAQLRQYLQQIFHVDIPLDHILQRTTIDSLVNLLSWLWCGREIVEEIAWTFLQIKGLSDDEVNSQLAKWDSRDSLGDAGY
jgi:hypothetical protein